MLETRRAFFLFLLVTLILKLALAVSLPITTDEAYFYIWGMAPGYGYYDHPPMVGWLFWLLLHVSDAPGWMRLVTVLLTSFIGWGIYRVIALKNEERGILAGILFMIMPVNMYGVLLTTDTPLVLWSFLSVIAFYLALERNSRRWLVASGFFLGLAVLSKYFAALLGFSYLVYVLIYERNREGAIKIVILYGMTLPALLLNLAWNYNNCWGNYMFNFVNRNEGDSLGYINIIYFVLMWVYFLIPPILFYLYRRRRELQALGKVNERLFLVVFFVPLLIFFLLSFGKTIGVHWAWSFYAFIFMAMAFALSKLELKNSIKVVSVVTGLHVVVFAILIASPYTFVKPGSNYYDDVVMGTDHDVFLNEIAKYRKDYKLASLNYSISALMTYYAKENVSVIGYGTKRARHDDIMTDFRKLDGQNILVFYKNTEGFAALAPMFESVRYETVKVREATFYLMLGDKFNYEKYRQTILTQVKHWYQIPHFLPHGACYFYDRYFPGEKY